MIPIRDTVRSRNYPVINTLIIGFNVLLFLVEMGQGPGLNRFIFTYGLVPARYSVPDLASHFTLSQQVFSLLSFMFLHGGFWHLLGNMWSLYIFGDNVEDRLGHLRYLGFYLLCGLASGLTHLFTNWYSQVPTIGASGAIAGVMGAYFVLYPRAKVLTLIPIFFIPYFVEVPAFIFLGVWFLIQFLSAAGSQGQVGGIAWWAHIGGFLFGMLFLRLLIRIPAVGMTSRLQSATSKRRSPHLQVIHTDGRAGDPHLRGYISVTPQEARQGTRKLVNIPWGFHKRLFRVHVPPGVTSGTLLRLQGMGKEVPGGGRGDLHLEVLVESQQGP